MASCCFAASRRRPVPPPPRQRVSPLLLEVFNSLFMSIAEQMGATLANTAVSVNIKERLDFSCAVFDANGGLVANAPHLPVHLGSMGASVQAVLERHRGALRPGDAWLLNSPYAGGTHLPDLTVVTPVFLGDGETGSRDAARVATAAADDPVDPLFFVASRAHHADVGGVTPGSMPPGSRTIEDEGVLIEDFLLVEEGSLREAEVAGLLTTAPHPVRDLQQNLADLRAQVAANARGAAELGRMVAEYGLPVVAAYMRHVQDNAAEAVRRVLDRFAGAADAPRTFRLELDDGSEIVVGVTVDGASRTATVDFTGTSPQRADNFNAPEAVTTAAVLYVFRTLVDADIPLNAGCLEPIDIVIPPGSMLSPVWPAAVAAGNVETSQAVTAALLGALGAAAASQGTMNNLTFGDDRYQYYETLCGGAGAGPDWDGCSAVHTHMTNSRLTDPEVLEWRYPVRVEEFRVRTGSGGAGAHRGGDGAVRRLRFLEPLTAAIVSSSRRVAPYGSRRRPPRRLRPERRGARGRYAGGAARRGADHHGAGRRPGRGDARRRRLRRAAGVVRRSVAGVAAASLPPAPRQQRADEHADEDADHQRYDDDQPQRPDEIEEQEVERHLHRVLEDVEQQKDHQHDRDAQLDVQPGVVGAPIATDLHLRLLLQRAHAYPSRGRPDVVRRECGLPLPPGAHARPVRA